MSNQRQRYVSYLLRLWQTQHEGRQVWRYSLESPGTGERRGFTSLSDLCAFLAQVQDDPASAAPPESQAPTQPEE